MIRLNKGAEVKINYFCFMYSQVFYDYFVNHHFAAASVLLLILVSLWINWVGMCRHKHTHTHTPQEGVKDKSFLF